MCPSPFNPMDSSGDADTARNVSSLDPNLSRTHYFDGRLLKASDLIRDQLYLDERLREVGRALGEGIVRGLAVTLDGDGHIRVGSGLAVAPSGRVLELEAGEGLEINLFDRAAIAELNPGFRYFPRGLYAVTLSYAEKGEGSAEAYPRDLAEDRGFHFNAFAEGVELGLTPLRMRQPHRTVAGGDGDIGALAGRAALVRELLGNPGQPPELPEHAVALGAVAIEDGRPVWLDRGLVRRPHRPPAAPYVFQADLHRHYEELLAAVLAARRAGLREETFPAGHYFELLPPYGSLPAVAVNPEQGRQGFFPEGFEVSVAPVREDDLPAIIEQSRGLEPIDLRRDRDVDIMVLVPLSDHQFAWRARQLQHAVDGGRDHTRLEHLDPLALRLYGEPAIHDMGPDAAVWRDIMARGGDPVYVRRPARVAETRVSAVVLARGYELPDSEGELPADGEGWEETRIALENRVSELEGENDRLREALESDPDERLDEARERIAELRARVAELEGRLEDIPALEEQLDNLTGERDQLQEDLAEARSRIEELEAGDDAEEAQLRARVRELEQQLETARNRVRGLEQQLETARTRNRELKRRLEDAKARIEELESGGTPEEPIDLGEVEIRRIGELAASAGVDNESQIANLRETLEVSNRPEEALKHLNFMVALTPERYTDPLWLSMPTLVKTALSGQFVEFLQHVRQRGLPVGLAVGASMGQFRLSSAQRSAWAKVDLQG